MPLGADINTIRSIFSKTDEEKEYEAEPKYRYKGSYSITFDKEYGAFNFVSDENGHLVGIIVVYRYFSKLRGC